MPELGTLNRQQIGALAGVAPFNDKAELRSENASRQEEESRYEPRCTWQRSPPEFITR